MGSKSGRKRRQREAQMKDEGSARGTGQGSSPGKGAPQAEPAPVPASEPAPADPVRTAPEETVADTSSGSTDVTKESGPRWTPPAQPASADREPTADVEPALPLASSPAAAPSKTARPAATANPGSRGARGPRVAHGARETLDAVHRLETHLDRLTDWMGRFTAWYQFAAVAETDLDARREQRRRGLVSGMMLLFTPLLILAVVAIRRGWF